MKLKLFLIICFLINGSVLSAQTVYKGWGNTRNDYTCKYAINRPLKKHVHSFKRELILILTRRDKASNAIYEICINIVFDK